MTASRLDTDHRMNRLYELYAFVIATNELLQDAPRFNSRITSGAARAIRWVASEAFVRGNGVGKPLGFLSASALVTVTAEAAQAADTIVAENVLKMYSRLIMGPRAFWMGNSDILSVLSTMTIGDRPVWLPPTGLVGTPNGGILLGRPLHFLEHADTLGDLGDLVLVNPDGYQALRRTDAPQFANSIHLFFDYNMEAFRWTFRFGGQPLLSAAVTPPNSALTKSHFVTLAART